MCLLRRPSEESSGGGFSVLQWESAIQVACNTPLGLASELKASLMEKESERESGADLKSERKQ